MEPGGKTGTNPGRSLSIQVQIQNFLSERNVEPRLGVGVVPGLYRYSPTLPFGS